MKKMEHTPNCPFSGDPAAMSRFALGAVDPRFKVLEDIPTHSVELDLRSFDASSEGEKGGTLVCIQQGEAKLLGLSGRWTLPSGYMVFIPAERSYRLASTGPVRLTLIKFSDDEAVWQHPGCWAVSMPALAVEMTAFSLRWGPDRNPADTLAKDFFKTLGQLFAVWFDVKRKMWTPFGNAPDMERAIAFARDHLETASITETALAVGMSERTLRRRFRDELGINWRDFINEIRMTKAMSLLRSGNSVTETAYDVGFSSIGAFSVAFSSHAGMPPSAFLRSHSKRRDLTENPAALTSSPKVH